MHEAHTLVYTTWMSRLLLSSFVAFCIVGAISSSIDVGILYVLVEFFQFPVYPAAAVSLIVASLNGYILNKCFTFKDTSRKIKQQYLFFLLVALVGLILTLVFLRLFIDYFGLYYIYAKMLTLVIVVFWNFSANRTFVFTDRVN